jgi:uncharacterized protein YcbK (DUF882 family)
MGDISKNFSYKEFFVSRDYPELAEESWEKEKDTPEIKKKLKLLCFLCLQPVRDHIEKAVTILNGYRSQDLNSKVGGVEFSDHRYALAADFTADCDMEELFKWCVKNLCYRQIIYYPLQNFIHVSFNWYDKIYKHDAKVKHEGRYISSDQYFKGKE